MKIFKLIVLIIFFLLALALGAENQEIVTFNYLFEQRDISLATLVGLSFVSGFIVSWLFALISYVKLRSQLKKLNKQLKFLATEQAPKNDMLLAAEPLTKQEHDLDLFTMDSKSSK